MLDYIWGGIMLVSIVTGLSGGRAQQLTAAVFSGSAAAISLLITLCAGICFWSGIMRLAQQSGITGLLCRLLRPAIRLIFTGLDPNSRAAQSISMNIAANMLGLGNAATPFGLDAMRCLQQQNQCSDIASEHMVRLVVLNTASVQIIPTTVMLLRMQHGAQSPSDILVPVWICSAACLVIGLVSCMIIGRLKR